MFRTSAAKTSLARAFSTSRYNASKVAVLGAGGGIGQPLSLLLKTNPLVTDLTLYDIRGAPGVAADVGHINTSSNATGYGAENDGLKKTLAGAKIVVIPAGVPRKPGMTRDDLFNTNASIVRDLAKACAEHCPDAHMLIIANPVNSTVPIVKEVYKKAGVYDAKKLFGVTTLDVVRASKFIGDIEGTAPETTEVPVLGGHSGVTIVPLLSQAGCNLTGAERDAVVKRIQFGGDEVVKAKDGSGSATLSMAFAGARFTNSLLRAAQGESGVVECTFVESPLFASQGCDFFSSKVELGPEGVKKIHDVGKINEYEQGLLDACVRDLAGNIKKGVQFVAQSA
ncbi:malate dehydrogenase [Protomyces lactucae-debilis]|uniref:Malate dehydrogenase n=1 Tax=Protomyces lactucae-debilis TaxID=2754530 RepID=A0A1Y2ERK8_PROLT|nr:malate dehydrogenase [Protomyces lactucae-debilis]ORY74147.1 malate dehydrogenase [Protomyces lactucae-debilis]